MYNHMAHFTFSCNAKIKIILQLQDTFARVCAFETLWHVIKFTQKNENPKLTQGTSPS